MLLDTRLPNCLRLGYQFGGLATIPALNINIVARICDRLLARRDTIGTRVLCTIKTHVLFIHCLVYRLFLFLYFLIEHMFNHVGLRLRTLSIHYLLAFPTLIA